MVRPILLLGNPKLYEESTKYMRENEKEIHETVQDLHDTLLQFRQQYHCGRAIAAPQIGVQRRLIYMYINEPTVFINPTLQFPDNIMMEVMDDCMSFPNLLVQVMRYKHCTVHYKDIHWNNCSMNLEGDLAELIQHEYDHLDGILAVMRAINNKSFVMKQ